MPYGTVKVDNITFDQGGVDQNVTASGIYRAITSGVTVTGTISGAVLVGTTTVSGATVTGTTVQGTTVQGVSGTFTSLTGTTTTGTTANFVSGVFTTRVSGATITGTTAQFTSGTFVSLTGTTITGTTINGTTVSSTTGTFTSLTGTTITGTTVNGTTVNSITGNFTSLTGVTVTGTTANFTSGVFTTLVSGLTVTGTQSSFTSGNFVTLSGATATFTSGVIASGTAAAPSLSILGDPNTGIYSPGADQVAISTNGTNRLHIDSDGKVGIGTTSPAAALDVVGGVNTTGAVLISSTAPALKLQETDGVSTHNRTWLVRDSNSFQVQTRSSADAVVSSDYFISSDASGATTHGWRIAGAEEARLTGTGLGIGTTAPTYRLEVARLGTDLGITGVDPVTTILATAGGGGTTTSGAAITVAGGTASACSIFFGDTADGDAGAVTYDNNTDSLLLRANGAERARIDSSGRLLVGTSTSRIVGTGTSQGQIQIEQPSTSNAIASLITNRNVATVSPRLELCKTRGTTNGSTTIVTSADLLGGVYYNGADGTNLIPAASVEGYVDGTPGTDDMPGRLVFSTTADGASSPTERMRIDNQGRMGFNSTTFGGGNGAYRFAGNITGSVISQGIFYSPTVQSDSTTAATLFSTLPVTASNDGTPYTITTLRGFLASQGTFNADSTVTNQRGFEASSVLIGATNNYGFFGNLASATGRWNFWANGTAPNYFAGDVRTNTVVTARTAPANSNDSATATASSLLDGLRTGTPTANINLTLPTGTDMDAAFQELQTNQSFEWSVINLAAATHVITVLAGTSGHTVVGNMNVVAATSGRFITRKTAANTFISYRIA
jgi:hypothetical protein